MTQLFILVIIAVMLGYVACLALHIPTTEEGIKEYAGEHPGTLLTKLLTLFIEEK